MRKPKQTEEERKAQRRACTTRWTAANSDRIKKNREKWKAENAEHVKAYAKEWRIAHPEKAKIYRENQKKAHPGKNTEQRKKRREERPDIHRKHFHDRRARKKANGGELSSGLALRLLAFQKNRCAICRASLKKTSYHLDHIVPLAKGGKNIDSNIQLTCPKCNKEKHSKDPIVFMQEKGFLL